MFTRFFSDSAREPPSQFLDTLPYAVTLGGGQGIAGYDRKINFLPTPWYWRCGHMASAQTTESSQKSSESQVTDPLKDTIALDVQGPPYIAWVLAELSATGEVTEGAVFSGCTAGGWVEDHQRVQLHSFLSGLFLLLPSSLGFLAFCWFYKLPAFLSINSSHYALIIHGWFLLLTTKISGW